MADLAGATHREFFAVRTVAETLAGFRPARRTAVEAVALAAAHGRVPAEPVRAPHDLPGFARSTVDGYAVRAADTYGASEGLPAYLDVPLDWKPLQDAGSMLGSGALTVAAQGTNLLAAGTNVLRFFRNESCGKCVPCRVGSMKAHTIMTDLLERGGGIGDVPEEITTLEETLRMTSICGLGQVAMGPLLSVLGMDRGGAEAREHPKDPEDTEK